MPQEEKARQWYLHRDGQQHGPISDTEFHRLVSSRQLRQTDAVWFNGLQKWVLVSECPAFNSFPDRSSNIQSFPSSTVGLIHRSTPVAAPALIEKAAPAIIAEQRSVLRTDFAPATEPVRGAIFISYRRSTDAWAARSIFEFLARDPGEDHIFMDIEGIEPGENFRDVLKQKIRNCTIFVPLISPAWLEAKAKNGFHIAIRRPDDFVRLEIESALEINRDLPGFVVPLLIDDTIMPDMDDLPGALSALSDCQAMRLTHSSFRDVLTDLRDLAAQRARERTMIKSDRNLAASGGSGASRASGNRSEPLKAAMR